MCSNEFQHHSRDFQRFQRRTSEFQGVSGAINENSLSCIDFLKTLSRIPCLQTFEKKNSRVFRGVSGVFEGCILGLFQWNPIEFQGHSRVFQRISRVL